MAAAVPRGADQVDGHCRLVPLALMLIIGFLAALILMPGHVFLLISPIL